MLTDKRKYYNDHYRYELAEAKEAPDIVNRLHEQVLKNNQAAIEEVIKIVSANTFYLVCNRLENSGNATFENVDDLMQLIRIEIFKISFRGTPEYVNDKNFYGFLMGVAENCIKNFRKQDKKKNEREQYDAEEKSVFEQVESSSSKNPVASSEELFISRENEKLQKKIIQIYLETLANSKMPPQQLLTYCYSVLIPQLYKKTSNEKLLGMLEEISSRKTGKPNSRYNKEANCLEGDIVRDSVILIKWAMEAMYERRIEQLNEEYLEIYQLEKICGFDFRWGMKFLMQLDGEEDGEPLKNVVITKKYKPNNINNWPKRVMDHLVRETAKDAEKVVGMSFAEIVEEMF